MNIKNFADIKLLLLDNKTIKQTIFKNTFWLAVAEGTSRLLKLILLIYVARILGATEYGKFTFALAFVSLFVIFSDFGLSQITTREFARKKEREKEFSAILSLKTLLSLGTLILMLVGSLFITPDPVIQKIIWILAIYILINSFSEIVYAFLRARQRMEYEAGAKILQALMITGIGFFVILNFPSVESLSYGYLIASTIALIFILLFFHFKIYHLDLSWNKAIWQKFLGFSWPLALTALFISIYNQIDSVMLGYLGQITETGWYNAAYKIINATIIPMMLISQSFYPALSKVFKESKEKLQNIWNYQMGLMIILSFPLVVGGIALAPKIINFIYNPSYTPSILAFQILIVMAGIVFLCGPFHYMLIVANQQKKLFYLTLTGAVVNVILNFLFIPRWSLYGAALATVITYFLLLILYLLFTKYFTPTSFFNIRLVKILIITILATIGTYFIISQSFFYNLNIVLLIILSIIVYSSIFLILKKLKKVISIP